MWTKSSKYWKALLKTFKSAALWHVLLVAVFTVGLSVEASPTASDLPSNQEVLSFLTETLDWYRHRLIEQQIATEPGDLVFLEDNRPIATKVVQISFDFAKADASIVEMSAARNQKTSTPTASASAPHYAHFDQSENNAILAIQQATQEVDAIKKKLRFARGADHRKLQAALDTAQGRLKLLQAEESSLQEVIEFVRTSGGRQTGDLQSSIDDLAQTVPDVTTPTAVRAQMPTYDVTSIVKPRDSGILGLSSEVSELGRKLRVLDDEIRRTDKLKQSTDELRRPLLAYAAKRFPAGAGNDLLASDLSVLQQQKAQMDALRTMIKVFAPAVVALEKRNVLLEAYSSRLKSWRASILSQDEQAWKGLIFRLLGVAVIIGLLLLIGPAARRFTDHHVGDAERRHVLRVILRVVIWFAIVLVLAFSFTSDLSTLATIFALVAAGVAVALQNVILAAVGYFLVVGRRGMKIGDRVQISGVTGDVSDIGWLQFQLREIDSGTRQPTGRVVTFSNSLVFVSPATGLSKFKREDLKAAELRAAAKAPLS